MTVKRSGRDQRSAAAARKRARTPSPLRPHSVPTADELEPRSAALLWKTAPVGTRGPKPTLTAERIALAAIEVADSDGLAAVSMSRIAQSFGFTTMSLYRYVPGKTELVDLMFDTVMGRPPDLDAASHGWRIRLDNWGRALWSLVLAHPWTLEVLTRLRLPGPNEMAWMECGARALGGTGLNGAQLLDALFLIVGQVRIVAQYAVVTAETAASLTPRQWAAGVGTLLNEHAADFPALTAATSTGAFAPVEDALAFGLDRVLDGIQVLVGDAAQQTP